MKRIVTVFVVAFIILGIFFSRSLISRPKQKMQQSDKIRVVASFYPLYFFAGQIGGEKADVVDITPFGAEPHDYEPTSMDMAKIENSRILLINGNFEPWIDKVKTNLEGKNITIVTVGEGLFNQKVQDPHVWLSPKLAQKEVKAILDGFQKADSPNRDYYQKNADKLLMSLDDLDKKYQQGLSSCKKKNIITSHSSFNYLANEYGFIQTSISGLSPDSEPSPKQLAEIADFAKKNNIDYIFFEKLISPKLAETIAFEIGAKTLLLDPLEGISQKEIESGENYFTKMEDNLTNLKLALQCNT
ncbi:zinc ABC transporter substrate-binding protein [Candidatus Gottesmanbacteria bacterium]|nr:zinc ABC transporter substrate-binding protein [Candidatus Gottesmanbacteria bacterium]